jgi:hypothetical protein
MTVEEQRKEMMNDVDAYLKVLPLTSRFVMMINLHTIKITATLNYDVDVEFEIKPFDELGHDYWLVGEAICKGLDQVEGQIAKLLLFAAANELAKR